MSENELNNEHGQRSESPPVSGRPTKALFSMMENEAGGVSPQPFDASDLNREFVYQDVNPKDYYNSNFPSLITQLGPNARHRTRRNNNNLTPRMHSGNDHTGGHHEKKRNKEQMTFGEQMRRYNEARWLRIEAVAKEKLDFYDKYVSDMTLKIKQQRAKINQRTDQLLQTLQKQEERKREDKLYASPYGRMWRHHRTMQRRAYSLEPMRSQKIY